MIQYQWAISLLLISIGILTSQVNIGGGDWESAGWQELIIFKNTSQSFQPTRYKDMLFIPMGNYDCRVAVYDGTNWYEEGPRLIRGKDYRFEDGIENIGPPIEYKNKLYLMSEGDYLDDDDIRNNDGGVVYVRDESQSVLPPKSWTVSKGPVSDEYASFGAAVYKGELYTGISNYFEPGFVRIYKFNNTGWEIIKTFNSRERLRAWALGSDGTYLYVGIGELGRGTASIGLHRYDGISWVQEATGWSAQSFTYAFGTMFAGGNDGWIYKRASNGTWGRVFNTKRSFVISLITVNIDGKETLLAGTENYDLKEGSNILAIFKTTTGSNNPKDWQIVQEFNDTNGSVYLAEYKGLLFVVSSSGSPPSIVYRKRIGFN